MVEAARKKGEFPFFQLQLMVLESNRWLHSGFFV
jgi:hypothetical protein